MTRKVLHSGSPLAARTTAELAAEWIRQAIMKGDYRPGERLVELKLAGKLGIGQATVREALKELENQGFVQKTPKRGTHVTKLTPQDFEEIHEVRLVLEGFAVERAAVRMTDAVLKELEAHVNRMERGAKRFELIEYHEADMAFHRLLWQTSGNKSLTAILERVTFSLFAFFLLQTDLEALEEHMGAVAQHRQIIKGLASRDPAMAREAFTESTMYFWSKFHHLQKPEMPLVATVAER